MSTMEPTAHLESVATSIFDPFTVVQTDTAQRVEVSLPASQGGQVGQRENLGKRRRDRSW